MDLSKLFIGVAHTHCPPVLIILDSHRFRTCTRYEELANTLSFQIEFARAACLPSEFRLLNSLPPIKVGVDLMNDNSDGCVAFLNQLKKLNISDSNSQCPLWKHIREVAATITPPAPTLRVNNQKACVIIVTQGECTDGTLAAALRPLAELPVHIVLRLCTGDKAMFAQ